MKLKGMAERICGVVVVLLALWTVLCNLCVWWKFSLDLLLGLFFVCLMALAVVAFLRHRSHAPILSWLVESEVPVVSPAPPSGKVRRIFASDSFRMLCAALGASGVVLIFAVHQDPNLLALAGIVFLLGALISTYRRPRAAAKSDERGEFLLLFLALALVVFTLAAHRPDADDCFYVNVAARAVEQPQAAFLQHDGIFGIPDQPIVLPGYRIHSWEPLAAVISRICGLAPILSLHWVLAAFVAFLTPFAIALFLKRLLPRHWLGATVLSIVVILCMGETHSSYGNFAFVRMQQGKSALVTLAIPLIAAYALRYTQRPTKGNAFLLFATQVMAVGMNFSAVLLAPAVAWLTILASWDRRLDRWIFLGLLASAYPLLMLGVLAGPTHAASDALLKACPPGNFLLDQSQVLDKGIKLVLGQGRMRLLAFFFMFSAWSVPRDRRMARMMVLIPLAFFLFSFNSIAVQLFAKTPQSQDVWFRAFWAVPLPHFIAVGLCAPLVLLKSKRALSWAATAVFAIWLLVTNVGRTTFAPSNGTAFYWPPRVKAPLEAYSAARTLVQNVEPGAKVIAPVDVSAWVPTFRKPVYPLFPRFHYQCYLSERVDPDEVKFRRSLAGFVTHSGENLRHPEIICFNSYRGMIDGWCVKNFGEATSHEFSSSYRCGFVEVQAETSQYRIWTRHVSRGE